MLALVLSVLSVNADAQTCRYNDTIVGCTQTDAGNTAIARAFASQGSPTAQATTTTGATGGSNDTNVIAFTGAESSVLGYIGAGLIGFGAVALGVRRKL
jgi:hypothetical protein